MSPTWLSFGTPVDYGLDFWALVGGCPWALERFTERKEEPTPGPSLRPARLRKLHLASRKEGSLTRG